MDPSITDRLAELSADERRLVEATALAGRPISLTVAVALGAWNESELLDAGDRLASAGLLGQSAEGFLAAAAAGDLLEGMGEMRRSATAGALADAFRSAGGGPELFGPYLAAAARWAEALPPLSEAGLAAVEHRHMADAVPLLELALEAAEQTNTDDRNLVARLHLARAQAYRLMGRSDEAVADAAAATRKAEGSLLTDALEWQSRLADDQQRPQDADGYLATAQLTAAADPARLGKLHSLRARTLSRIGYPVEAEASHEKAEALLTEHGSSEDRYSAKYDEAWVAFDQGRAEDAADRFAALAEQLSDHQVAELADIEVWLARSLFSVGRAAEAEEIRRRAMARAQEIGALGPVFLGHMALAEGAGTYGAWEESLRGADAMLEVVLSTLPAWENAARYLRARALNGLGRNDEAGEEIDAALAATPAGINGWRWRNRCRALQWRIEADAGGKWDDLAPADLTEELLAVRFYSQAAELLGDRVKYEKDPELGRSAAALALRFGQRAEAARALSTTKLWDEPEGVATAHAIRNISVPDEWADAWAKAPGVARALTIPEVEDVTGAATAIQADLDAAFARAGLEVDDRRLSPAQRISAGLRIKEPRRPRRRRLRAIGAVAGVVLIAAGAGASAAILTQEDPPPTTIAVTTTTTPRATTTTTLAVWDTELAWPGGRRFGAGSWAFHGETDTAGFNGTRDGISPRSGAPEIEGFFWKYPTNEPIDGSPAVRGTTVYIGSANMTFYAIDASRGRPSWTWDANGPINSSPSFTFAPTAEDGGNENLIFYGSDDGTIYAHRTRTGQLLWTQNVGARISAPVIGAETRLFAPAEDGRLYAFEQAPPGNPLWVYPPLDEPALGPMTSAPLYVDGNVIVVTTDGLYLVVNSETGEEVCTRPFGVAIDAAPTIVEDASGRRVAYLPTGGSLYEIRPTTCDLITSQLYSEFPAYASPVVIGNLAYITDGQSLVAMYLRETPEAKAGEFAWRFRTDGTIRSSPSVTGGVIYFGSDDGNVYAVNLEDGTERWRFQTGGEVRSSPAPADGVVYFGSRDGFLYAVGAEPES